MFESKCEFNEQTWILRDYFGWKHKFLHKEIDIDFHDKFFEHFYNLNDSWMSFNMTKFTFC